ncbi:MAG: hypothetical protein HQM09_21910 [Candidatus Riflebacteria bacterium]|nr:hypothetical protein [Candidatus Riflebacteria bacterium]
MIREFLAGLVIVSAVINRSVNSHVDKVVSDRNGAKIRLPVVPERVL